MRTLRIKITVAIVFSSVIIALFVGFTGLYKGRTEIMKESKAHLLQLTQKYSSDFEMRFAKMELLFTKFQQIDYSHTRLFEGTGIGLAISKKMSALIGGEVGVVSAIGEGSEFFIKIPYIKSLDN